MKIIYSWAVEVDFDAEKIVSNTFIMEWPPESCKFKEFPERKLPILDELMRKLEA
jgi:predicted NUDIX family NTP pyrophosphohydrolase